MSRNEPTDYPDREPCEPVDLTPTGDLTGYAALADRPVPPGLQDVEDVECALLAADAGNAGHWPTVAAKEQRP